MLVSSLTRRTPIRSQIKIVKQFHPQRSVINVTNIPKSSSSNWSFQNRPKTYIFGIVSGLGTLAFFTNDDFHDLSKHTYLTIGRVGVVTAATMKCFYHYKMTLGKEYLTSTEKYESLSKCHKKCALITLKALEQNGGIYIKLGQHISAMTYLLPPEWTDTMIPLQDKCPESTIEEINEMFKSDLGQSIDEMFEEFELKPIGVASLAQVHVAKLRETGEKVAVKCQHPSLKQFVPLDVFLTQTVFKALDKVFPEYPLVWLGDELQSSIYVELNFNTEAENSQKTDEYFKNFQKQTALRIPKVVSATNRILIMEYLAGARLDNLTYMDSHNIMRSEVSSCLSHIFNNMIFTPNVGVHCDPHGGNLAIRVKPEDGTGNSGNKHNFEIILYDHGLYRQVPTQMRRDYARFWLALLDKDQEKMKLYAKRFAGINDEQFPIFAAAITGRDIKTALNYDISKIRDANEIENMKRALTDGELLTDLMIILSHIPRVVLLILKTNDLTRNLDEVLQNPLGPERTFLILNQYCSKSVYQEDIENAQRERFLWRLIDSFKAWMRYNERISQLYVYDLIMLFKNWFNKGSSVTRL